MKKRKYVLSVSCGFAIVACGKGSEQASSFQTVGRQPDVAPVMLNKDLPFRYPPALFAQKVQGNVTLRIYIDRTGKIVAESTHVAETSGFSALDSAAVKGSRDLKFEPAKTQGQPVPVSILLPVFFRYPGAPPLPGDSVLKGRVSTSSTPPSAAVPAPPTADSLKKAVEAITKPRAKKPAVRRTPARSTKKSTTRARKRRR